MDTLLSAGSSASGDSSPRPALKPGYKICRRFTLLYKLGAGGMGTVYAARDSVLGRLVVIKMMHAALVADQRAIQRFANELHVLARLTSNRVINILDAGTDDGVPFMVLEYLRGQDLAALVRARGPLAVQTTADLMVQACEGVAEIHEAGIVHRDLKAENLFLTETAGEGAFIKIIDFGIAESVEHGLCLSTGSGESVGSPDFMAPEQMRDDENVDRRSDIWALGGITYFLLTGQCAFASENVPAICAKVLTSAPTPPSQLQPEIPEALERIVLRCLEKSPERRYQEALELRAELLGFVADTDVSTRCANAAESTRRRK